MYPDRCTCIGGTTTLYMAAQQNRQSVPGNFTYRSAVVSGGGCQRPSNQSHGIQHHNLTRAVHPPLRMVNYASMEKRIWWLQSSNHSQQVDKHTPCIHGDMSTVYLPPTYPGRSAEPRSVRSPEQHEFIHARHLVCNGTNSNQAPSKPLLLRMFR